MHFKVEFAALKPENLITFHQMKKKILQIIEINNVKCSTMQTDVSTYSMNQKKEISS